MNRKTLFILISLSLLAGVGPAGGLYLVSTPTNLAPTAATLTADLNASPTPITNYQLPITSPTPTPSGPVTREEIISSFGQNTPRADLNADGVVNSLDLAIFDLGK